jgi:hypothetical protein
MKIKVIREKGQEIENNDEEEIGKKKKIKVNNRKEFAAE